MKAYLSRENGRIMLCTSKSAHTHTHTLFCLTRCSSQTLRLCGSNAVFAVLRMVLIGASHNTDQKETE